MIRCSCIVILNVIIMLSVMSIEQQLWAWPLGAPNSHRPPLCKHSAEFKDVLRGRSDGAQRNRSSSNMVRVFISSTFTDMSIERKALLEKAYPEVLAFCRSLGLVFEVVDLRWGIRSVPSGDHEACEISLQEIQTSKRVSAGPAFI
ncbi:hypothetical protein F7725_028336, partial [Dissostichus mawsoni]